MAKIHMAYIHISVRLLSVSFIINTMKMKNIGILMMALCMCVLNSFAGQDSKTKDSMREISIRVVATGNDIPIPRPRSGQAIIAAVLDENQLWIDFYESVGKVTIAVKNSCGQVVCAYSCDTAYEPMVIMTVPTDADCYTLGIVGNQIEAYGEYTYE